MGQRREINSTDRLQQPQLPSIDPGSVILTDALLDLLVYVNDFLYYVCFNSWVNAYNYSTGYTKLTRVPLCDAYRYIKWPLSVPLLLVEIVLVIRPNGEKFYSEY